MSKLFFRPAGRADVTRDAEDREKWYRDAAAPAEEVLARYGSSERGLDGAAADRSRETWGTNVLTYGRKDSVLKRLCAAFLNPFTVVLLALAGVSVFTDLVFAAPEDRSWATVVIITAMVALSGALRFVQETRSGNVADKLTGMLHTTATVLRDGAERELPLEEVAVGDVIRLSAGDMLPADVRILTAKDLFVSQSALTGESEPVEKLAEPAAGREALTDLRDLAFLGSSVISGSALALVIAVGDGTMLGALARTLQEKPPKTTFERGVNAVSWVLIRFMLAMVPVVLFVNGFTKGDWMQAVLFAISVAVGLTPEMLPMIVTTSLARGALAMSGEKVIIKHLNAIQDLGSMDVLCTDKTGTLTRDEVVLEYHLNVDGEEDDRVLRHAFLNSHFQTGLKNLIDIAVIQRQQALGAGDLIDRYEKVDEIPFDFERRRMSVVVRDRTGKTQLVTKGAVEEMLGCCAYAECGGAVRPLTDRVRDLVRTRAAIRALEEAGVRVKVLTGDNERVTRAICRQVGLAAEEVLLGTDLEAMDDAALGAAVETGTVFAKLSPAQKARVVKALRANGHCVGHLGDGINDAAAMKAADVGISVDTAVDIAKESASVVLLEKDLMVLERGVLEGRKTYANMIKYIKMTASSNFGNMFSVLAASAFLPFLPMASLHLLLLNLIYDVSCMAISWDNVDADYLRVPRKWDASGIGRFMLWMGPTSSVFDIITYLLLYFVLCPALTGLPFHQITDPALQDRFIALFQTGWFIESMWSQTLVIHMIRTPRLPFLQSRASGPVTLLTFLGIAVVTCLPFSPLAGALSLAALPGAYFLWLAAIILGYMALATAMKQSYIRRFGQWL